jgi:putative hydrolase of the HAD superfamily
MYDALLLDVGYVILEVNGPSLEAYELATGKPMPARPVAAAGVPGTDAYWETVAREAGFDGLRALFVEVAQVVPEAMFDQGAVQLMRDARAAGRRVGVLSNDAYAILGREFFANRPEFAGLDAFVDAVDIGVRKPDPQAYILAAEALAVAPEQTVFLDDTPECIDGAREVGMVGILVDPLARTPAFDEARQLLGLAG